MATLPCNLSKFHMKVFIDFDDVIFDTKAFIADYKNAFFSHGVSPEKFEECYYDYPRRNGDGTISKYEFRGHLQRLEKSCPEVDIEEVEQSVMMILKNASKYIFEDVGDFIASVDGGEVVIVSYGDAAFQHDKIESSGIMKLVSDVVITDKMKSEAVGEIIGKKANDKMIFIDDRIEQIKDVKKNFRQITTFFMKRPEGRYDDEFDATCCDYEVRNLQEITDIINRIGISKIPIRAD